MIEYMTDLEIEAAADAVERGEDVRMHGLQLSVSNWGGVYAEMRLVSEDGRWIGAQVAVRMPSLEWDEITPARVTWSSSGSHDGLEAAVATADTLRLAVVLAERLDAAVGPGLEAH